MLPHMSKRNLNRRQKWRISKIQEERLARASKRDEREGHVPASDFSDEQRGLVVTHYGKQVVVRNSQGASFRCHFRATFEQLVVGDQVLRSEERRVGKGCRYRWSREA